MPFATKQKNKVQGSLEHYDSRHFAARCIFFELWFASMPTVHHYSFHRLFVHGASLHVPPIHHHHHHHHLVHVG